MYRGKIQLDCVSDTEDTGGNDASIVSRDGTDIRVLKV